MGWGLQVAVDRSKELDSNSRFPNLTRGKLAGKSGASELAPDRLRALSGSQ
jgi:hypothetical protein